MTGAPAEPRLGIVTPEPGHEPVPSRDVALQLIHDLRSPLAVVRGYAELLGESDSLSEADRSAFTRRIADAATELVEMLDAARRQL